MIQRAKAALDVGACSHLFGGADEDADPAGVHGAKEIHFRDVAVGVVDEGDLVLRNSAFNEAGADFLINIETGRMRRGEVAENELSRALASGRLPDGADATHH